MGLLKKYFFWFLYIDNNGYGGRDCGDLGGYIGGLVIDAYN